MLDSNCKNEMHALYFLIAVSAIFLILKNFFLSLMKKKMRGFFHSVKLIIQKVFPMKSHEKYGASMIY